MKSSQKPLPITFQTLNVPLLIKLSNYFFHVKLCEFLFRCFHLCFLIKNKTNIYFFIVSFKL